LRLGLVSETWGTYCTLGDNNTVYVLDEDSAESLTQPQSYYRSLTVLGGYYSLSSELETITIDAMDDGTTVSIERRDTSDLDADVASAYSTFVLTEPIAWAVDDTTLTNGLLSDLQDGLTAQSIVTDAPEDLGDYGLDENAARIHLTANNLDAVVLVGDTTEDDGIYIMQEGSNTVYLSDASAFDFLEEDWNTWRSTALFNCAKAELETVTVRQDDMVYEVQFTKIPADENEEEDEDTITATCNGTELSDEEMEQFCLALISVDYTRLIDEPEAQTTQPEAEVDITMTDGTKHTLAFTKGGSREYLVSVDGAGYAYGVHQAELDNILNALQSE
jgi:hypothetical protein